MKKKRWIIPIIAIILVLTGTAYFLYVNQLGKFETKSECQDFIDECCKKERSYRAGGGMMIITHKDGTTNIDDKCNKACPKDCSRYTEERGYFRDEQKKQEYYNNKVKECRKKYEECLENTERSFFDCHKCDKYGQPIYQWD